MSESILKVEKLYKTFEQGGSRLNVLNGINLAVDSGEIVALVGPSGSGKSTLLQIIGLLDRPTSGEIYLGENKVSGASEKLRTQLRRDYIGFVYQFHYLQPEFTALENVVIPQMIAGKSKSKAELQASGLLKNMKLDERMDHRPARLSGGEQQRVAIARSLANSPKLLLADEPTGNLDPETSATVFAQLLSEVRSRGIGALVATHNMDIADKMDRVLELKQGRVMAL
jgi:lipoprotein-releasing system ATP-binding protein